MNTLERSLLERVLELEERLVTIGEQAGAIMACQGYQEELSNGDPGNVTVWAGPRLSYIIDLTKI